MSGEIPGYVPSEEREPRNPYSPEGAREEANAAYQLAETLAAEDQSEQQRINAILERHKGEMNHFNRIYLEAYRGTIPTRQEGTGISRDYLEQAHKTIEVNNQRFGSYAEAILSRLAAQKVFEDSLTTEQSHQLTELLATKMSGSLAELQQASATIADRMVELNPRKPAEIEQAKAEITNHLLDIRQKVGTALLADPEIVPLLGEKYEQYREYIIACLDQETERAIQTLANLVSLNSSWMGRFLFGLSRRMGVKS